MKNSSVLTTAALGVVIGLSLGACADPTTSQQSAAASPSAAATAVSDYNRGVNPETNVPVTGIYDQEDRYRTATGFPAPGDEAFFGEPGP